MKQPAMQTQKFIEQVDVLYFDVKHYDSASHRSGTGVSNELILKNLQAALKEKNLSVTIRIPVIPDFNDSKKDAEQFAELFTSMNVKQIELLPFHQFGEKKYAYLNRDYTLKEIPQLHTEELDYFKEIIEAHQIECHVQ